MKEDKPIKTPRQLIRVLDDNGTKLIKQNNLTVAMGYNKYLSPTNSRLCKCIANCNALKRIRGTRWLDLKIMVENVLPLFLSEYFLEIRRSPSQQQFCGNPPEAIYENTKAILEILKERLKLCYGENLPAIEKGNIGERFFKNFMEKAGCHPISLKNCGYYDADFSYECNGQTSYVEVKTYDSKIQDGVNVFILAQKYIDRLKRFVETQNSNNRINSIGEFVFIDAITQKMYSQRVDDILNEYIRDELKFPIPVSIEGGGWQIALNSLQTLTTLPVEVVNEIKAVKFPSKTTANEFSNDIAIVEDNETVDLYTGEVFFPVEREIENDLDEDDNVNTTQSERQKKLLSTNTEDSLTAEFKNITQDDDKPLKGKIIKTFVAAPNSHRIDIVEVNGDFFVKRGQFGSALYDSRSCPSDFPAQLNIYGIDTVSLKITTPQTTYRAECIKFEDAVRFLKRPNYSNLPFKVFFMERIAPEYLPKIKASEEIHLFGQERYETAHPVDVEGDTIHSKSIEVIPNYDVTHFTVEGVDKLFLHGAELAVAAGFQNKSGATSDCSTFSKAVKQAGCHYYRLKDKSWSKSVLCIDANDAEAVLMKFSNLYCKTEEQNFRIDLLCDGIDSSMNRLTDDISEPVSLTKEKLIKQFISAFDVDKVALKQFLADRLAEKISREQKELAEKHKQAYSEIEEMFS